VYASPRTQSSSLKIAQKSVWFHRAAIADAQRSAVESILSAAKPGLSLDAVDSNRKAAKRHYFYRMDTFLEKTAAKVPGSGKRKVQTAFCALQDFVVMTY
jgi:hypothetical protein